MLASVIICTFNRCELLRESVLAIQNQNLPTGDFEIIVVDNNSTDGTRAVSELLAACSPVPIRYVLEAQQGLSFARNRGIIESSGEITIFVDDDIDADTDWLKGLVAAFDDPSVSCAGGPVIPRWPFNKPQWLTEEWEWCFSINEYNYPEVRETGEMKAPFYPLGANIAFRKSIFEKVGTFATNLGRIGKSLLSGDETDICARIEAYGARLKFAEHAVIHHKISPDRVSKTWLLHRAYWEGRSKATSFQQTQSNEYARLKQHSEEIILSPLTNKGLSFAQRCQHREAIGYLYQLLESDNNDFRKLRALKTFFMALSLNSNRIVERWTGQIKQQGDMLEEVGQVIRKKDLQLRALQSGAIGAEHIPSKETLTGLEYEKVLKIKDTQLNDMLESYSWKITAPVRWACGMVIRFRK